MIIKVSKQPVPFRFSFNLPDFIADTHHLAPFALGCLLRLMMFCWRNGPPKDDNRVLARIAGTAPKEWAAVRPELEPFFVIGACQWSHEGVDRELEAAYIAIHKKKAQTLGAREALREKRAAKMRELDALKIELENLKQTNHDTNARSNSLCNNDCNNFPTTSNKERPSPRANESNYFVASFADDVVAAEQRLGLVGGVA